MSLESLIAVLRNDTEIEIVTDNVFDTIFTGEAGRVFVRPERDTWKEFTVSFMTTNHGVLYIEVSTL